jgi:hypothetical protein
MSGKVNYANVIDRLVGAIKELNQPCGEQTVRARTEDERRRDAVRLLRALLRALEEGPAKAARAKATAGAKATSAAAAAASAAAAAAVRGDAEDAEGAGQSGAFWAAMKEAAANGEVPNPDEFYDYVKGKGIKGRDAEMLFNFFYRSDGSADDDSNGLELQRHAEGADEQRFTALEPPHEEIAHVSDNTLNYVHGTKPPSPPPSPQDGKLHTPEPPHEKPPSPDRQDHSEGIETQTVLQQERHARFTWERKDL